MVFRQRRDFLKQAAQGAAGVGLAVVGSTLSKAALGALPDIVTSQDPNTQPPPLPSNGLPFHPVVTLNGWSLPLHGYSFTVVGTDGGWINPSARWPEVTTDVGVGQMRAIEFEATELGDWALHCHKSHHTMNAMSHSLPNMIGVDTKNVSKKIKSLIPDYMAMGESGMAMMSEMNMPLPENTLPMMMGKGQFSPLEMGGMFTVVKVRKDQPPGDYKDPGWYAFPKGSVAYQWDKPLSEPHRDKLPAKKEGEITLKVRKPKEHC